MKKDDQETAEAEEIVELLNQLLLSDQFSEHEKAQVLESLTEIVKEDLGRKR
jgi:hypothetical protein